MVRFDGRMGRLKHKFYSLGYYSSRKLSFHHYSAVDLIGYSSHCGFLLIPNLKSESSIFGALRAQDDKPNVEDSDNRIEIRKKSLTRIRHMTRFQNIISIQKRCEISDTLINQYFKGCNNFGICSSELKSNWIFG